MPLSTGAVRTGTAPISAALMPKGEAGRKWPQPVTHRAQVSLRHREMPGDDVDEVELLRQGTQATNFSMC
eukprot:1883588-Amphidinium_carterae.1